MTNATNGPRTCRSNGDRPPPGYGPAVPVASGVATGVGGVPLRYEVFGSGDPVIVCCNGVGVSTFFWKYVVEYFAPKCRIVTWDYRGHNASGMPEEMIPANFTIDINARDTVAVFDAAGVEKAVLLGHSMGCQVILEIWRQFPERVAGLVPICGPYGRPLDTALGNPNLAHLLFNSLYFAINTYPDEIQGVLRPLLRSTLPIQIARLGAINAQLAEIDDMRPYFDHLAKMDLRVFFLMFGEMQKHDAGPWLERIDVPTLVVSGERDLLTPQELSREMADRIPHGELLVLPRGSHAGLIEHPELLNLRLEKFIHDRIVVPNRPKPRQRNKAAKRPAAKRPAPARSKTRPELGV